MSVNWGSVPAYPWRDRPSARVAPPALVYGEKVAWSEKASRMPHTDSLSSVHRVGEITDDEAYTLCGRRIIIGRSFPAQRHHLA